MNHSYRLLQSSFLSNALVLTALTFLIQLASGVTFTNPVLWEDLADLDIFRVDNTFYYSASSMHYSPGAPILKSYDLVNWEFIGHSVSTLPWGAKYNLTNGQAYVKGIYASALRYRPSNGLWYWIGCIEYSTTYVWTAPSVTGPWTQAASISTCYYDCGLLIDDDDTMYVAYGNGNINVAQLSSNGLSQVTTQQVFTSTVGAIEGNRMYKVNGNYYIFNDLPASAEYVLKASSPFGPYTQKLLESNILSPVSGSGIPHQGGIVDTPAGDWYYMAFIDNYPGGRTPVLAPITWGSDGFPVLTTVNGGWGVSYPYPVTEEVLTDFLYTDSFSGTSLSPQWEWNHNPNAAYYSVNNGVRLATATVTSHLYLARNTLTHRIHGPNSRGTIQLTVSNMMVGDRAGLAMLRDSSAYVAIINDGSSFRISQVSGLTMDANWNPLSDGVEEANVNLTSSTNTIWFRVATNISPGPSDTAQFAYSTDGNIFNSIGSPYQLNNTWEFFMGYRYGIFNYATQSQGGNIVLNSFTIDDETGVSGPAPGVNVSTTAASTTGPTSTTKITTITSAASTSSSSTQSKYGQCGGSGYIGPTVCAVGSTCSVGNPWYSQCL